MARRCYRVDDSAVIHGYVPAASVNAARAIALAASNDAADADEDDGVL
jgi:hypothetical protein